MTALGLTLFYGGLVRRKNILGTMMQSFAVMGLITILWALIGYSLAFGHGNAFIGSFQHVFSSAAAFYLITVMSFPWKSSDLHGIFMR